MEIGALMAADPALSGPRRRARRRRAPLRGATRRGTAVRDPAFPLSAAAAITAAAEAQAAILEALPDPDLAQRASDVRQVAEAVIAWLAGARPRRRRPTARSSWSAARWTRPT